MSELFERVMTPDSDKVSLEMPVSLFSSRWLSYFSSRSRQNKNMVNIYDDNKAILLYSRRAYGRVNIFIYNQSKTGNQEKHQKGFNKTWRSYILDLLMISKGMNNYLMK